MRKVILREVNSTCLFVVFLENKEGFKIRMILKPRRFVFLHTVSLLELIDTTARINQLLFAREEGVAVAANIHFHRFTIFRRARFESSAASAGNRYFVIVGMDISFHIFSPRYSFFFFNAF